MREQRIGLDCDIFWIFDLPPLLLDMVVKWCGYFARLSNGRGELKTIKNIKRKMNRHSRNKAKTACDQVYLLFIAAICLFLSRIAPTLMSSSIVFPEDHDHNSIGGKISDFSNLPSDRVTNNNATRTVPTPPKMASNKNKVESATQIQNISLLKNMKIQNDKDENKIKTMSNNEGSTTNSSKVTTENQRHQQRPKADVYFPSAQNDIVTIVDRNPTIHQEPDQRQPIISTDGKKTQTAAVEAIDDQFDLTRQAIIQNETLREIAKKTMLAYPLELWKQQNNHTPSSSSSSFPSSSSSSSSSPPDLRIFVYETSSLQPDEVRAVRQCCLDEHLQRNAPSIWNFHADLALLNLFETSPLRTYNPNEADIYIVPYAHACHCLSPKCQPGKQVWYGHCGAVAETTIAKLLRGLEHLRSHPQRWERHLFVMTADTGLMRRNLESMPLQLTIGYTEVPPTGDSIVDKYNPYHLTNGQIIVPYLNDHPWFQPSAIIGRSESWWTTRKRKYSFVYLYGGIEGQVPKDTDPRRFRHQFVESVSLRYPGAASTSAGVKGETNSSSSIENNRTLGGLPFLLERISNKQEKFRSPEDFYRLYQNSLLCPCLPGDAPAQKRFFDAIMSGCIPVVVRFPPLWEENHGNSINGPRNTKSLPNIKDMKKKDRRSWIKNRIRQQENKNKGGNGTWHPWEKDIPNVYPFAIPHHRGKKNESLSANEFDNRISIDYKSFVIQAELPVWNGTIEAAMEEILSNPIELRRRQLLLKKYAPVFSYGLGPEAHLYSKDAFGQILAYLHDYVSQLSTIVDIL